MRPAGTSAGRRSTAARLALLALLAAVAATGSAAPAPAATPAATPAAAGSPSPSPPAPAVARAPAAAGDGDAITIQSDGPQSRDGNQLQARDRVRIRYRDMLLEADRVTLDQQSREVVAEGNVTLHEGSRRLAGERLEFNLDSRTGRMWMSWGFADPDVYFSAAEVEKVGDDRYQLRKPQVTSCNQPLPQWRLRAAGGSYHADRWVRLYHARLEVFGVPLVYLPFFQYPAREDRSTGFLFPAIGTSSDWGFNVANSFFWAIGRSYDATITHQWFEQRGNALLGEFRYLPSTDIAGTFESQNHFDTVEDQTRSSYRWAHNQRLGQTWRLAADVNYNSDEDIDRDYSNSVTRITSRTRTSTAFLARNWSRYSLGVGAWHQVYLSGTDQTEAERTDFRLPGAGFAVRETRLLGPIYGRLGLDTTRFGQKGVNDSAFTIWQRLDANPMVRMPLRPFPWLQLTSEGGYRTTWYSRSYLPGSDRQELSDEGYLRGFGTFGADLVGPVFQRVFHTPNRAYSDKFKHVIEPTIAYDWTGRIDPDGQAPQVDGLDRLTEVNQLSMALRNRLYARRAVQPGAPPQPYELLTFGLGIVYSLDPDRGTRLGNRNLSGLVSSAAGSRWSPLFGDLRFVPTPALTTTYRFYFDTDNTVFTQQSLQATWRAERWFADFTYSRSRSPDRVTNEQLRAQGNVQLGQSRLLVGSSLSYDLLNADLLQFGASATYRTQCCGFGVGYSRFRLGSRRDNLVSFSVSLKNIGTVFDYTLGDDRL